MKPHHKTLLRGMFAVASGLCVALPLGFWFRPGFPTVTDNVFAILIVLALVAIATGVMRMLNGPFWQKKTLPPASRKLPYPDELDWNTGYQLSYEDFKRLVAAPAAQPEIARWVREWFDYEIRWQYGKTIIRANDGAVVGLYPLHAKIQMDPVKQKSIYGQAMDLWR